jgi:hypothetical protein
VLWGKCRCSYTSGSSSVSRRKGVQVTLGNDNLQRKEKKIEGMENEIRESGRDKGKEGVGGTLEK